MHETLLLLTEEPWLLQGNTLMQSFELQAVLIFISWNTVFICKICVFRPDYLAGIFPQIYRKSLSVSIQMVVIVVNVKSRASSPGLVACLVRASSAHQKLQVRSLVGVHVGGS